MGTTKFSQLPVGSALTGDEEVPVVQSGNTVKVPASALKGLKGDTGDTGPAGPTGPAGADGAQGIQGLTGPTGQAGAAGATGAKGDKGDTGNNVNPRGSVAAIGNLPSSGNTPGDFYLIGAELYSWNGTAWIDMGNLAGPQGIQGIQGTQGIQGIQGEKGDTGLTGETGATGSQGIQGPQGYSVSPKGSVAAVGNLPSSGNTVADFYLVSGVVYMWSGSGWVNMGSIVGPQGEKGDTGSQGVQGNSITPKGNVATVGALPSTGQVIGDLWLVSADGSLRSWNGSTWVNLGSIQGAQGIQGIQGIQGVAGTNGYSVTPKGTAASVGALPASGNTQGDFYTVVGEGYMWNGSTWVDLGSLTGPQGIQGIQGIQGATGNTGAKGDTGTGIILLGTLASTSQLPADPSGYATGSTYIIDGHFWTVLSGAWTDVGSMVGPQGESAYDLWLAAGNTGDVNVFLASLKGDTGTGIVIHGTLVSSANLPSTGQIAGDSWFIGSILYTWDGTQWTQFGPTGPQGIQGIQGIQGVKGDTGSQGTVGPKGDTGSQGIQGIQGIQGAKGDKGDTGAAIVPKGTVASVGDLPASGNASGDTYFVGGVAYINNGAGWINMGSVVGPQGPQGATGSTGAAGHSLTPKGTVAAVGNLPSSGNTLGDLYFVSGVAYSWDGTAWINLGSVIGPQGIQGVQGVAGTIGVDGAQGPVGPALTPKGTVATVGALPSTGNTKGDLYYISGVAYAWDGSVWQNMGSLIGPQGIQGVKGDTGATGNTGLQGTAGTNGTNGISLTPKGTVANVGALPSSGNVQGDLYFVSGVAYAWDGTAWQNMGSVVGPQGIQGVKGDTGTTGTAGTNGHSLTPKGNVATVGALPASGNTLGDLYYVVGVAYSWDGSAWIDLGSVIGPQGIQGIQGIQGTTGTTGAQGAQGASITPKGTVATVGNLPASGNIQGDLYFVSGVAYIWSSTAWVNMGSLVGPQGATGTTGTTGATGAQGASITPKGTVANVGALPASSNVQGDMYYISGVTYIWSGTAWVNMGSNQGQTGAQGPTGADGAVGATGPQGAGITPKGTVSAVGNLPASGNTKGDTYNVGTEQYIYDGSAWVDMGNLAGPTGATGPMGPGITIVGSLSSTASLPGTGTVGQGYLITGHYWGWTGTAYEDMGQIQGPQGNPGPTGPTGATGAAGPTGPKGNTGNGWIVLNRTPTAVDGNVNDFFLDSVTQQFYQKTGATTWSLLGTLGGGNVYDANLDGVAYVRQNGAWVSLQTTLNRYSLSTSTGSLVSTTMTLDASLANVFTLDGTTAKGITITNLPSGRAETLVLVFSGAGGSITWNTTVGWSGGTTPSYGTTRTLITLFWDGTNLTGSVSMSV